jgi:c-di-GMP-binding flagellar brake protein YcgR
MEQRASPRFRLDQAIRLGASADDEDEYLSAEIVDLSAGGVGILSSSPVPAMSPMFLMFGARGGDGKSDLVRCEGYAIRSAPAEGKYLIGVKFTSIDPGSSIALQRCLESLGAEGQTVPGP